MLNLTTADVEIFKQVIKYIDKHYMPDERQYADNFDLLLSSKPVDEDCWIDDIYPLFNRNQDGTKQEEEIRRRRALFSERLLGYLDNDIVKLRGCCRKACLSKVAFNKLCEKTYAPSKEAVCNLIVAAELNIEQARQLLSAANILLLNNNKYDVAISFFLTRKVHDFSIINKTLYLLDLPMLCYYFV